MSCDSFLFCKDRLGFHFSVLTLLPSPHVSEDRVRSGMFHMPLAEAWSRAINAKPILKMVLAALCLFPLYC